MISAFSKDEIKKSLAIGFVPMSLVPVNKIIDIQLLEKTLIAVKYVDLDNKEQASII